MTIEIIIPKLGVNVTQFRIVEWKAKEGDRIEKGCTALVIETEKTTWEIEAEAAGFLHILYAVGEKVAVGQVAGLIAETKPDYEKMPKDAIEENAPSDIRSANRAEATSQKMMAAQKTVRITPAARKMAKAHPIDITRVKGTGPGGRIGRKDIENAIAKAEAPTPDRFHGRKISRKEPLQGMRQSIADHMYRSLAGSAQMTVMGEFDVTEMVKVRQKYLNQEQTIGVRIGYVDMLVYLLAKSLKKRLDINCSLFDGEVIVWADINIGVAVALGEAGLIVPVVKNADARTLIDIAQNNKILREKAPSGKLLPDEVTGGTFTLSTMGRNGESRFQTPILNQPEAAILGVGPIADQAVVRNGEIVVRPMMPYSMTFDHRVINGYGAERFLSTLRQLIEDSEFLLFDGKDGE